jgi:aspartate/methionine/tyrosine aminotransferase
MKLPPFLLDEWLDGFKNRNIRYDLATSTGPAWTLRELLALATEEERRDFQETNLLYGSAPGREDLRALVAAANGAKAEDVLLTTGAAEALHILFFAAADLGANVVVPAPAFPPMHSMPAALGLDVRTYALRPEAGYRLDVDEVRRLVDDRTRLLLVNSPHNPTGAALSASELRELHDLAAHRGIPFVCDEVYHPLYYAEPRASAATLPHATLVNDFSKALCLSGLRLGWLLERDRARRSEYLNTRMYFTVTNAALNEALALLAWQKREVIVGRALEVARGNLAALDAFVDHNRDHLSWVRPQGGTTAFPWLTSAGDSRPFCIAAAQEGVLLAPGDCFGQPRHFRIGFGSAPDLAKALPVLEGVLRQSGARLAAQASA